MAKGGYRPGGGRKPHLNPDGTRKHPVRIRNKAGSTPKRVAKTAKAPVTKPAAPSARPAAPAVNPFMTMEQALVMSSLPPPHEALAPNPPERPALPVATDEDVPGGMPEDVDCHDPEFVERLTPLEYMLREMNYRKNDKNRRDRMAVAAAPFVHVRAGDVGKKGEREQAAAKAGAGKFGAAAPPRLAVNNTK